LNRNAGTARYGLRTPRGRRHGFTIIELLVVIGIIVLVLGIGLPAFNSMTRESRLTKAQQLTSAALSRASMLASSEASLAAVRFGPEAWERSLEGLTGTRGLQVLTTYRYVTTTEDPTNPLQPAFDDRFERTGEFATVALPDDTWAAPLEALRDGPDYDEFILNGRAGVFTLNAAEARTSNRNSFLPADDFLIVFLADGSVAPYQPNCEGMPPANNEAPDAGCYGKLSAYDPETGMETAGIWRNNPGRYDRYFFRFQFSGVVFYPREPFLLLGPNAKPDDRRAHLLRHGLPYFVNRAGGALAPAQGGHR